MTCTTLQTTLALASLLAVSPAAAQAPKAGKPKGTRPAAKAQPAAPQAAPKDSADAAEARQAFAQVLNSVNDAWFGQPYQGVGSVALQGNLGITLSGQAVSGKVDQLSQGQVKASSKGGTVNLRLNGVYFANGDFRTEMNGDFGNLLYTRRGNKGYLYSREQNAYTTRIDLAPADAPLTFMAWFRQTLNDIKTVYVDGNAFRASLGGEETSGGRTLQKLVFSAPTGAWDAKKREQSLAETLGFWKRGRLEVAVDKATKLPYRMTFRNEEQGVETQVTFTYGGNNHLTAASLQNRSRGFEGPGNLLLGYAPDGTMNHVAGELTSENKRVAFDMSLAWSKDRKPAAIASIPPAGAAKRGREELETLMLVGLADKVFQLQHNGLNLRSVSVPTR